jgi:hypothetical protein
MPSPANEVWCNVKISAMVLQQRFPRKGFIAQTALVRSFRIHSHHNICSVLCFLLIRFLSQSSGASGTFVWFLRWFLKKLWSVVHSRTDAAMVVRCTAVIKVAFCGRLTSQIASENLMVYIERNLSVLLPVLDDLIKLTKNNILCYINYIYSVCFSCFLVDCGIFHVIICRNYMV